MIHAIPHQGDRATAVQPDETTTWYCDDRLTDRPDECRYRTRLRVQSFIGGSPVAPRQEVRSQAGVWHWSEVIRRIDVFGSSRLLSRSDRATFSKPLLHSVFWVTTNWRLHPAANAETLPSPTPSGPSGNPSCGEGGNNHA